MSNWFAFVPRYVAVDLIQNPTQSPIGRDNRFEAVVLFADVSGFTPISEALGKTGRSGTEELTTILNSYFTPMIDLIRNYGGIVGKFGGDAMTILFPYDAGSRPAVVRRGVQCALEMQARMEDYAAIQTSAGTFSLAMKAGLAAGPIFTTTVGDAGLRLEYIIAGRALDLCADAEHHAERGEVVIHRGLLADLGEVDIIEEMDDFLKLGNLERREPPERQPVLDDVPESVVPLLNRYLHPTLAHRLASGRTQFMNEHRRVTVLFIRFKPFDYDHDPAVGDKLQAYLSQVVHIVQRYDGYLNKVDMGDKGSKMIVLFGTPLAHENDEERAIRCALELARLPDRAVHIGVNSGFVYAGQVGSPQRQEYTVMGDVVNLSARLMQAAEAGQILVSEDTYTEVRDLFEWERLAPVRVKGKSAPVQVYAVERPVETPALHMHEPSYALPMVGRQAELATVEACIDRVLAGRGQVIGITAEAGMGKSRLNAEVVRRAVSRGLLGFGGECQSYGTTASYLVWHPIWRGFFGLDSSAAVETQIEALREQLAAIDPHYVQRLPLLGVALNITIPDNELTASLEPQLRHDLLHELLSACVRHRALAHPLMFVLEDCHWIDSLSLDLLEYLARNSLDLPVLLVVLYRPLERERVIDHALRRSSQFTEIELDEFSVEEAGELIRLKLENMFGAGTPIPEAWVEQIVGRAQGNPFYIEELLNFIHDQDISPEDQAALGKMDLPDSLYNLILSRIDRLGEDEKIVLKVASVIGRLFKAHWIWGFYPDIGLPEAVKERLQRLSRVDLTPLDKPEPELEYLFKHIITQEVAYETLAYALRGELHEQLGHFIERTYASMLENYIEILAHHFGHSQNVPKQVEYFRRAGDMAQSAYANDAALDYYERLLARLPENEQPEILLAIGSIRQLLGEWDAAEEHFRRALALSETNDNREQHIASQLAIGNLHAVKGDFKSAIPLFITARAECEASGDEDGLCKADEYLSFAYWQQADYDQAIRHARQHLSLARQRNDPRALSDGLRNLGMVYMNRAMVNEAVHHLQQALAVAEERDYLLGVMYAAGNLGVTHGTTGGYAEAIRHYGRALRIAADIGYLQITGILIGNMGDVYRLLGGFEEAIACSQHALTVMLDLGDWRILMVVLGNLASLYAMQGRIQEAEGLFRRVLRIGRAFDYDYYFSEYLQSFAALLVEAGRLEEARSLNEQALRLATETERPDVQFEARLLAIRLAALLNTLSDAGASEAFNSLLAETEDDSETAAIHYELWRLNPGDEAITRAARSAVREVFEASSEVRFSQIYADISGEELPSPAVPPLPEVIGQGQADMDVLLNRLDVLMAAREI